MGRLLQEHGRDPRSWIAGQLLVLRQHYRRIPSAVILTRSWQPESRAKCDCSFVQLGIGGGPRVLLSLLGGHLCRAKFCVAGIATRDGHVKTNPLQPISEKVCGFQTLGICVNGNSEAVSQGRCIGRSSNASATQYTSGVRSVEDGRCLAKPSQTWMPADSA